jgi:hypothetical protein
MGLDLFEPVLKCLEGSKIIDRIRHYNAHGSFVVSLRYGLESFLPSCIPDLKPDLFIIYLKGLYLEVDSWIKELVPMVVRCEVRKLFSQNRRRMFVLPTPLSPMISNLAR